MSGGAKATQDGTGAFHCYLGKPALPTLDRRYGLHQQRGARSSVRLRVQRKEVHSARIGRTAEEIRRGAEGDAENIPLPDNSVDAVLSFRLLNLVPFVVFTNIIKEFKRVSSGEIIFQIRVNEELSFIALIGKILLDPRTHLNRIAAYLIDLVKNFFFSSKKEDAADSGNIYQSYFIHDLEAVLKQLDMNNLTIKQTIEIDKGVDYSKGSYIPYLIFRCTQDK